MKLLLLSILASLVSADINTTNIWSAPYISTKCNGKDASQFPSNRIFFLLVMEFGIMGRLVVGSTWYDV
ncbi:hypothetical protein CORC01_05956 [Colletotrichum orchidophilum]|uniref:Uncharacterized protein n=1 Tax=Colletotrichum orchidophilum TaxID=1209926 RepID=A0A1G4BBA8_9PEZI|nr:uncharacterized protein CORC01_05956 [Colletotrichum orchidophilum]OHE98690.1 hypothetical protein CORC01_05956 [Colletotrichum orchidophilum]